MSDEWKPERYHDTYREDLLARVEEKVKAGETEVVPEPSKEAAPRQSAQVVDLVALLQKSLKGKPEARHEPERGASTRRAAASARRASTARGSTKRASSRAEPRSADARKPRERKRA
jgi:DNA end-binding protein Ku